MVLILYKEVRMTTHQFTFMEILAIVSLGINAVAIPLLSVAWWAVKQSLANLREEMGVVFQKLDAFNSTFVSASVCERMHENLQRELRAIFAPLTEHVQRTQQVMDVKERLAALEHRVEELERR